MWVLIDNLFLILCANTACNCPLRTNLGQLYSLLKVLSYYFNEFEEFSAKMGIMRPCNREREHFFS